MFIDDKPPLEEAYLEHFGVKGMRWGQRKPEEQGQPRQSLSTNQKRAVKAVAIAGGVAVTAILLRKGNVKVVDAKSAKIYASGAKATGRILARTGKVLFKVTSKLTTTVGKGAFKGTIKISTLAGKGAFKGVVAGSKGIARGTAQTGSTFYQKVLKKGTVSTVRLGSHAMYRLTGRGKPFVDEAVKKSRNLNPVDLLLNTRADVVRGGR
jgi:hypothetical protein